MKRATIQRINAVISYAKLFADFFNTAVFYDVFRQYVLKARIEGGKSTDEPRIIKLILVT